MRTRLLELLFHGLVGLLRRGRRRLLRRRRGRRRRLLPLVLLQLLRGRVALLLLLRANVNMSGISSRIVCTEGGERWFKSA